MSYLPPTFELVQEDPGPDTRVIAVRGEIHLSTAPELERALSAAQAEGKSYVVVDTTEVMFIDSTGLGALLRALRELGRRGGRLALVVSNPTVLRLFVITGTDATFEIFPTRDAALAEPPEPEVAELP